MHAQPELLAELFGLDAVPQLAPRYNIAPSQPIAIVRDETQRETGEVARIWTHVLWGLIPSWAKDPTIGARMINARAETAAEKPSFRAAMRRRRCLVPTDGFFEWQRQGKQKQPFYATLQDGGPMAFAGLWETWMGPDGSALETCTVLTTEPNDLLAKIHNRMPVILAPEDYGEWLRAGAELTPREVSELQHLLRPYPADAMKMVAVDPVVNNARNEGPECILPVESSE